MHHRHSPATAFVVLLLAGAVVLAETYTGEDVNLASKAISGGLTIKDAPSKVTLRGLTISGHVVIEATSAAAAPIEVTLDGVIVSGRVEVKAPMKLLSAQRLTITSSLAFGPLMAATATVDEVRCQALTFDTINSTTLTMSRLTVAQSSSASQTMYALLFQKDVWDSAVTVRNSFLEAKSTAECRAVITGVGLRRMLTTGTAAPRLRLSNVTVVSAATGSCRYHGVPSGSAFGVAMQQDMAGGVVAAEAYDVDGCNVQVGAVGGAFAFSFRGVAVTGSLPAGLFSSNKVHVYGGGKYFLHGTALSNSTIAITQNISWTSGGQPAYLLWFGDDVTRLTLSVRNATIDSQLVRVRGALAHSTVTIDGLRTNHVASGDVGFFRVDGIFNDTNVTMTASIVVISQGSHCNTDYHVFQLPGDWTPSSHLHVTNSTLHAVRHGTPCQYHGVTQSPAYILLAGTMADFVRQLYWARNDLRVVSYGTGFIFRVPTNVTTPINYDTLNTNTVSAVCGGAAYVWHVAGFMNVTTVVRGLNLLTVGAVNAPNVWFVCAHATDATFVFDRVVTNATVLRVTQTAARLNITMVDSVANIRGVNDQYLLMLPVFDASIITLRRNDISVLTTRECQGTSRLLQTGSFLESSTLVVDGNNITVETDAASCRYHGVKGSDVKVFDIDQIVDFAKQLVVRNNVIVARANYHAYVYHFGFGISRAMPIEFLSTNAIMVWGRIAYSVVVFFDGNVSGTSLILRRSAASELVRPLGRTRNLAVIFLIGGELINSTLRFEGYAFNHTLVHCRALRNSSISIVDTTVRSLRTDTATAYALSVGGMFNGSTVTLRRAIIESHTEIECTAQSVALSFRGTIDNTSRIVVEDSNISLVNDAMCRYHSVAHAGALAVDFDGAIDLGASLHIRRSHVSASARGPAAPLHFATAIGLFGASFFTSNTFGVYGGDVAYIVRIGTTWIGPSGVLTYSPRHITAHGGSDARFISAQEVVDADLTITADAPHEHGSSLVYMVNVRASNIRVVGIVSVRTVAVNQDRCTLCFGNVYASNITLQQLNLTRTSVGKSFCSDAYETSLVGVFELKPLSTLTLSDSHLNISQGDASCNQRSRESVRLNTAGVFVSRRVLDASISVVRTRFSVAAARDRNAAWLSFGEEAKGATLRFSNASGTGTAVVRGDTITQAALILRDVRVRRDSTSTVDSYGSTLSVASNSNFTLADADLATQAGAGSADFLLGLASLRTPSRLTLRCNVVDGQRKAELQAIGELAVTRSVACGTCDVSIDCNPAHALAVSGNAPLACVCKCPDVPPEKAHLLSYDAECNPTYRFITPTVEVFVTPTVPVEITQTLEVPATTAQPASTAVLNTTLVPSTVAATTVVPTTAAMTSAAPTTATPTPPVSTEPPLTAPAPPDTRPPTTTRTVPVVVSEKRQKKAAAVNQALENVVPQGAATAISTGSSTAAAVGGAASPTSATKASNMASLVGAVECHFSDDDLEVTPLQVLLPWSIGDDKFAALLGPIVSCIFFAAVPHLLIVAMYYVAKPWKRTRLAVGMVAVILTGYLLPTVVGLSTIVLFHAGGFNAAAFGAGGIVLATVVGFAPAALIWRDVRRTRPGKDGKLRWPKMEKLVFAYRYFFDVARDPAKPQVLLNYFEDLGVAFIMSFVGSIRPTGGSCLLIAAALALAAIGHVAYLGVVRPFRTKMDSGFAYAIGLMQATVGAAVVIATQRPRAMSIVGYLSIMLGGAFMVQTVVMLVWTAMLLRRRNARRARLKRKAEQEALCGAADKMTLEIGLIDDATAEALTAKVPAVEAAVAEDVARNPLLAEVPAVHADTPTPSAPPPPPPPPPLPPPPPAPPPPRDDADL